MHVFGAQTILLSTGDCEILIPLAIHLWHPEKSECNEHSSDSFLDLI